MSKPILVLGQLVQVLSDRIGTVNVLVFINNVTMHERVFACTRNAKPIAEAIELICTLLHMTAHYCWEWSHTQAPRGESGYETDCCTNTRNEGSILRRYDMVTSPQGVNLCGM